MMTRISLVLCLCVLSLACGCGSRSGVGDAKKGMAALKDGRTEKAIAHFTAATQRIPNSPELYYHLGLAYLLEGKPKEAEAALQAALDLKPAEGEANILGALGQVAYHQKAYTNALASLQQALAVAPDENTKARILTVMGAVETCCHNYTLAHLYYLRALKHDSQYAPAYYNRATLYQDHFDLLEEALEYLEMFVRMADKKSSQYTLAENRIKRLRSKLAQSPTALANRNRDATRAGTLLQEGVNAHNAKQYPKAIKAYKDALAADPSTHGAAYGLGMLYRQQGMHAEALSAFKTAIEINPTLQENYSNAAELALQLRQPAEASRLLTKGISRSPYNPDTTRLMAQAASAEYKIPEAIAYGEFYLSLIPKNSPDRAAFEKWVQTLKRK